MRDGKVQAWQGIPYAAPPVGDGRFRSPSPVTAWQGVLEALEPGSPCVQLGGKPIQGEEDCLYLDVFAPASEPGEVPVGSARRPVMFWIHGGGNTLGSGDMLDPSRLAAENDVVVVTINYRLGVFGWFSHPALRASARDAEEASGNFGTLDMIRALEWTQENIANFGGDPNRVTIFGESAGGLNVFSLLLSPRARGLFHAAIAQSGQPMTMTRVEAENYTDDQEAPGLSGSSAELTIALLRQLGRAKDRESAKELAASMSQEEVETFLREFPTRGMLQPFVDVMGDEVLPMYMVPTIIRDGVVIPDAEPLEIFSTPGAYNAVPFIAGTNREEAKLFLAFSSPLVSRTFGFPTGFENERLYDVQGEYGGMMWRATGADEPLKRMRQVQGPSVWSYRFDWDEEPTVLGTDLSKLLGAAHALELFFVFGLTDMPIVDRLFFDRSPAAGELSAQMRSYWAQFAHTFRPGRGQGGELPEWQAWGLRPNEPRYMIFDTESGGGLRHGTDEIDTAFVLDRAANDPRLLDAQERCSVFQNFVQWSKALSMEDYAVQDGGTCSDYPLRSRYGFPSLDHWSTAN
jgi:para-nitrobenzyl esterase